MGAESVLVFDLEAVSSLDSAHCGTSKRNLELEATLRSLTQPQSGYEYALQKDVEASLRRIAEEDGKADTVVLASRLAATGYRVAIRTAVGGGAGQNCFKNLSHRFLLVSFARGSEAEFIVDPSFREQFSFSHSNPSYESLLTLVPVTFVGSVTRLMPLVRAMAHEMEDSFFQAGITMPPWRRPDSILSKWKPAKSRDTLVSSPSSSPKVPDGASPRGPFSLPSSRSSSINLSPERMHSLDCQASLSRQESVPKKIQAGFTPVSADSAVRQAQVLKPINVRNIDVRLTPHPNGTPVHSALPVTPMATGRQRSLDLDRRALLHIRTVRMEGPR